MAQIWRTVTGTFSVTGVKKATNTATQASTYDYQSSGYVGTAKNNGTNTSYALFCRPNEGDIFSVSDTAEILSMTAFTASSSITVTLQMAGEAELLPGAAT